MTPVSRAAQEYLAAGLAVIALTGKAPNGLFHKHGLQNALVGKPDNPGDRDLIEQVFTHPQTTGVGIVIQYPYFVVDVDGEEGAEQFAEIIETVQLDATTPIARTGRGLHIWYADHREHRGAKLGTKLDLKGVGGYVVAPPSLHPAGHHYEWLTSILSDDGTINPPIEMPDQLDEYLAMMGRLEADRPQRDHSATPMLVIQDGRLSIGHEPASISGLVQFVRTLPEGNRNHGLFWAASTAIEDGFTEAETMTALAPAAKEAGLAQREIKTAIQSAIKRLRRAKG